MDIERPDLLNRKRRRTASLVTALVLIGIACVAYIFTLGTPLPSIAKDEVWMGTVVQGDMLRNLRGRGKLVPEDLRWITARTSGRVEEKLVLSGAKVDPQTVILRLSNPELEQQFTHAQLELKAAQAELLSTRVRLESELLALRSSYTQLLEQADMAVLDQQINEELHAEGLVSERTLKRSNLSARHLSSRVKMEEERLRFQEQSIEPQLATQQTQVDRVIARIELLEQQIAALQVLAGQQGVLQRLELEQGQQVLEGQQIALVSDPSRLKAVIEIQENQAREIQIGQRASIDTRTSGIVEGVVSRIDPNVEQSMVKVDVTFPDGLPDGCRADQTVQGTIELQRLDNVLYVDRPGNVSEYTRSSVFRVTPDGKRAERTAVTFGRASVSLIEISEGLRPGDTIILSDTSRWEETDAIKLNSSSF